MKLEIKEIDGVPVTGIPDGSRTDKVIFPILFHLHNYQGYRYHIVIFLLTSMVTLSTHSETDSDGNPISNLAK